VLAAYVFDKALYERAYELRNRPDWIEVPLAAVEALLAHR
jgi:maltokinase